MDKRTKWKPLYMKIIYNLTKEPSLYIALDFTWILVPVSSCPFWMDLYQKKKKKEQDITFIWILFLHYWSF